MSHLWLWFTIRGRAPFKTIAPCIYLSNFYGKLLEILFRIFWKSGRCKAGTILIFWVIPCILPLENLTIPRTVNHTPPIQFKCSGINAWNKHVHSYNQMHTKNDTLGQKKLIIRLASPRALTKFFRILSFYPQKSAFVIFCSTYIQYPLTKGYLITKKGEK